MSPVYYIRDADKLQRTARWIESLPKGLQSLKEVIIDDKLGICNELEQEMNALVGTFHDEWAEVVRDPKRREAFRQFANTDENQSTAERIMQRGHTRPVDWPSDSPLKFRRSDVISLTQWKWRPLVHIASLEPTDAAPSSVVVKYGDVQIAIWSIPGRGLVAAQNMCPHKRAFVLADGLLGEDDKGRAYVSCPMHKRNYVLASSQQQQQQQQAGGTISIEYAQDSPDGAGNEGDRGTCSDPDYSIMTFDARLNPNTQMVEVRLPPTDDLDAVLSTTKWMIRKARDESDALLQATGQERSSKGSMIEITGPGLDSRPPQGNDREANDRKPLASCADEAKLDW